MFSTSAKLPVYFWPAVKTGDENFLSQALVSPIPVRRLAKSEKFRKRGPLGSQQKQTQQHQQLHDNLREDERERSASCLFSLSSPLVGVKGGDWDSFRFPQLSPTA